MVRKVFKRSNKSKKIDAFIKKYKIPREYLSVNRKAVTRGLLVGIFWGFIPMPFQMLAVLATTPLFRFNVPLAISMVWLSNPITMPFMYYMEYITGCFALGIEPVSVKLSMEWFDKNFKNILIPLYVGTAFYSIGVSAVVYFIINISWIKSVKDEQKRNTKNKETDN